MKKQPTDKSLCSVRGSLHFNCVTPEIFREIFYFWFIGQLWSFFRLWNEILFK